MISQIAQIYLITLHLVIVFITLDYHHWIYPIDIKLTRVGRLFDTTFLNPKAAASSLVKIDSWPSHIHSTRPLWNSLGDILVHKNHEMFIHQNYPYLMHLYKNAHFDNELARILYEMHFGGFYYLNLNHLENHERITSIKVSGLKSQIVVYTINKQITAILSMPNAAFWKYVIQLVNMRMPVWKQGEDFVIGLRMIKDALTLYEENSGELEWVHL